MMKRLKRLLLAALLPFIPVYVLSVPTAKYEDPVVMQHAVDNTPPPPDLSEFIQRLPPLGRPLRCACPCVGIDGCGRAIHAMGIQSFANNIYDLEPGYAQVLLNHLVELGMRIEDVKLNLGPLKGDLLRKALSEIELPVDLLVCGPPCPPWAGQGCHNSFKDCRAKVFMRIILWVIFLARCGGLLIVIIENVPGVLHSHGGLESPMDRFLRILREHAPSFEWAVDTLELVHYGRPQTRRRVFLRGLRKLIASCVPRPLRPFGQTSLRHVLARLPNTRREDFTQQQQGNIAAYENRIRAEVENGKMSLSDICVVAPDRQQDSGSFAGEITINNAPTLTTQNGDLFILSVRDVIHNTPDAARDFFRVFAPPERLSLSGFPPQIAMDLGRRLTMKASGNAYPPALILACLYPMIRALAESTVDLTIWPPPDLPAALPSDEIRAVNRKLTARGRIANRQKFASAQLKARRRRAKQNRRKHSDSD